MEKNKRLVAIAKDETKVFIVKNVSEDEYNRLLNKQNENNEKELVKDNELNTEIEKHKARLGFLESKTLFLAKSIYDNFVDRGLIENDDDFQKMWFDYYFNNKPLCTENAPQEYKIILDKVR